MSSSLTSIQDFVPYSRALSNHFEHMLTGTVYRPYFIRSYIEIISTPFHHHPSSTITSNRTLTYINHMTDIEATGDVCSLVSAQFQELVENIVDEWEKDAAIYGLPVSIAMEFRAKITSSRERLSENAFYTITGSKYEESTIAPLVYALVEQLKLYVRRKTGEEKEGIYTLLRSLYPALGVAIPMDLPAILNNLLQILPSIPEIIPDQNIAYALIHKSLGLDRAHFPDHTTCDRKLSEKDPTDNRITDIISGTCIYNSTC